MKLRLLFLVVVTIVLIGPIASQIDCPDVPPQNCPLFPRVSDRVSYQDLIDNNIATGFWLMLFGSEFDNDETYAKCLQKWRLVDNSNIIERQTVCYNNDLQACQVFNANVTWSDNGCSQAIESGVVINVTSRFYSQDPDQYLLFDVCYTNGVTEDCVARYLDILVRGDRLNDPSVNDVNLQYLPLHLIAIDLKQNFDMDFSHTQLFYAWKGPECSFNGSIV